MKVYTKDGVLRVELSRRNLETLLLKLRDPNSIRTLIKSADDGDYEVLVTAVEDSAHYHDRDPGVVVLMGGELL